MDSIKSDLPKDLLDEVGEVVPQVFVYENKFSMTNGELNGFQIKYETYGKLNSDRSNVILVCHALTGDHHVAGFYKSEKEKAGGIMPWAQEKQLIQINSM